jgi:hypothetical protein
MGCLPKIVVSRRVIAAAIVIAYFGGYFALSRPADQGGGHGGGGSLRKEPTYLIGGEVSETIYRPLEMLDRKLRPSFWATRHYSVESP